MSGNEALHWTDLAEEADLVHLTHNGVQNFAFEGPEYDRLILHTYKDVLGINSIRYCTCAIQFVALFVCNNMST